MSNVLQFSSEEARADEAILWITRIDRELDKSETEAFQQWLAASPENQKVFVHYAKLWDKMDCLSMLSELVPRQQKPSSHIKFYGIAASFVAMALLLIGGLQTRWFETLLAPAAEIIVQQSFSTQLGEQSTFYLQDKTKVVLNTNSRVNVTYTDSQRLFELQQGELYVEVAHNSDWPLSVHAADKRIQAVGTAFNVELKDSLVELIVTEGRVRVAQKIAQSHHPLQVENIKLPDSALAVGEGEKAELIGESTANVVALSDSDMSASLSWQAGELVFRGETLVEALQEVTRYTAYRFEYAGEAVKSVRIAGLYKTDDLETLLSALEDNLNVAHQRINANTIRLSVTTPTQ